MPPVSHLKKNIDRWYRPSELKGVAYDLEQMEKLLSSLLSQYLEEFERISPYRELQDKGFGLGYTPVDALTLYLMIRRIKPKRYIEVGSGLSTYYCNLAGQKNLEEGFPLKLTCIEPYPFEKLFSISGIEVLAKEVQDIKPTFFDQLEEGDLLFIDSSHSLRVDSDVPYLYLEILPRLKKGVFIHIHDIPFPYNVPFPPELWIFNRAQPRCFGTRPWFYKHFFRVTTALRFYYRLQLSVFTTTISCKVMFPSTRRSNKILMRSAPCG